MVLLVKMTIIIWLIIGASLLIMPRFQSGRVLTSQNLLPKMPSLPVQVITKEDVLLLGEAYKNGTTKFSVNGNQHFALVTVTFHMAS